MGSPTLRSVLTCLHGMAVHAELSFGNVFFTPTLILMFAERNHSNEGMSTRLQGAWRSRRALVHPTEPSPALDGGHGNAPNLASGAPKSQSDMNGAALVCVLTDMHINDVAINGRLACKTAANWFRRVQDRCVDISQPLLPHVADTPAFAAGIEPALHGMPMRRKLLWLATAAASGGDANLQVAWRALRSRLFPDLLQTKYYMTLYPDVMDPATAASESGHSSMIREVLETCPGFVRPIDLLSSVAEYGDLSGAFGLQATWSRLYTADPRRLSGALEDPTIIQAAMASRTPDAQRKVAWLVNKGATAYSPASYWYPYGDKTLAPQIPFLAAQGGGLDRLVWLCAAHNDSDGRHDILCAALVHCGLAAVLRLLGTRRCWLPQNPMPGFFFNIEADTRRWAEVLSGAACSRHDGIAKLKFLRQNGAPLDVAWVAAEAATAAAGAGELGTLGYICRSVGTAVLADRKLVTAAARSGSIPTMTWLLQQHCPIDNEALEAAAQSGDPAMVRWLLQEGALRPDGLDLGRRVIALWPYRSRWDSARLLQAVRLLLQVEASAAAAEPAPAATKAAGGSGSPLPLQLTSALSAAATRGDLNLVRLLVEARELVPDAAVFSAAAGSGCEALLEWLAARGCPSSADAWVQAARLADKGLLACMRRLGVPWDEGVVSAAASAMVPEPVLEWLEAECAPAKVQEEGPVVAAG